jgi:exopolysaccharide biosynthesis protein
MTKENVHNTTTYTQRQNDHTITPTNKQSYWIMGKYRDFIENNENVMTKHSTNNLSGRIQHFCTGFGWLVYDGYNIANNKHNPTGAGRAPRTAIGIDHHSNLLLVVVDGCEKWYAIIA